jgi:hypothetical protein
LCAVLLTLVESTAQAALIGVLPATPGAFDYQAYYDTDTNITWLANANITGDITYDDAVNSWKLRSMDYGWRFPFHFLILPATNRNSPIIIVAQVAFNLTSMYGGLPDVPIWAYHNENFNLFHISPDVTDVLVLW